MRRYIDLTHVSDSPLRDLQELLADAWGAFDSYALRCAIDDAIEREPGIELEDYCQICATPLQPDKRENRRRTCSDKCRKQLNRYERKQQQNAIPPQG